MNTRHTYLFAIILLLFSANGQSAPTGSDLLLACNTAQEEGYDSIQGQMCTWYIIPCNCSMDPAIPESCTPENMEVHELADIIIEGLTGNNILLDETATMSAAIILSEKFPCEL